MKKRLQDLSIKNKIILLMIPIIILATVSFASLLFYYSNKVLERHSVETLMDTQEMVSERMKNILADMVDCSNYVSISINKVQANTHNILLRDVKNANSIYTELNMAQVIFSKVDTIVYRDVGGSLYSNSTPMLKTPGIWEKAAGLVEGTSGESVVFGQKESQEIGLSDAGERKVTLGKKVIEISSGNTLGYLFVNVKAEQFLSHLRNTNTDFYLMDQSGCILGDGKEFPKEKFLGRRGWESARLEKSFGKKILYSEYKMAGWGWRIYGRTDLRKFNVSQESLLVIVLVIGSGVALASIFLSFYFTNLITRPLIKLKENTEKVMEGDFSIRCDFRKKDDIGQIGNSFDAMTANIQELIQKLNEESAKKREYELALIQEQVKPHFLYNSLDMIVKLSEMKKYRESQRVTKKLADYYRNTLSDSKEVIPLGQELKIVEDYMDLLQMRYEDVFSYHIKVRDASVRHIPVPKLTLQPLVENAVYHGLKYKGKKGFVHIEIEQEVEETIIRVIDNGVGMPQEIKKAYSQGKKIEDHFGIYSVNHRLKLFYGEKGALVFEEIEEGTAAVLHLPTGHMETKEASDD